jgi:hypothetical protein
MKFSLSRPLRRVLFFTLFIAGAGILRAAPDLRFDVAWFCCPCYPTNHLCEPQFDHLNIPSPNGHFMVMTTDEHRSTINSNGNVIAMLYNTFDDGAWTNAGYTGAMEAAAIDQWANANFTNTGPKPDWLIVNEISSGTWPGNQSYRTYVTDTMHALVHTYGYKVIIFAPFSNPGANSADWQTLQADAYIGVENYLSGLEIKNQNFSVSWCQSQYQSSITSYGNVGVPKSRLMLGEHFGQTISYSWGREGVSSNDWINAITVRSQAAANIGFPGYLTYAWYSDLMQVPDEELLADEDAYATISLPTSNPLSVPYIITQPQSQTIPAGSTATFSVVMAGDAALTYQWKKNGANLPGATTNPLVITNISGANNGVYSVVISNAVGSTNSASATLIEAVTPPFAAEPFAPGVTTYAVGSNLVGQTNAAGLSWAAAGPTGANTVIAAGNLTVPGLAASTGNSISFGVSTGPCPRFGFPNNFTSGTVYYSFAFRVDNLGSLNSSGGFFAAFNNSTGPQGSNPTAVAAAVQTRLAGSGFNVGIKGASGGSVFDTNVYNVGQTVFVVGSYTINPASTNDDTASLWINPDRSTFGSANMPAATLNTVSGGDIGSESIASFVFFRRGSGNGGLEPAAMTADELRIGTNWASVTPPQVISFIPTLAATISSNNVILSWSTNAVGFNLYSTPAVSSASTWTAVSAPFGVVGTNYVVTNSAAGGNQFYRLSNP